MLIWKDSGDLTNVLLPWNHAIIAVVVIVKFYTREAYEMNAIKMAEIL